MNTLWIFDIIKLLLIFFRYENGPIFSLHGWGWGSANHIPSLPAGSQPIAGSTGRLESWKRSRGVHLPVCFLFLFLFPVPVSVTLVSLTQQSTESLFQWQQLISLCSFSSTHSSSQRAPSSEIPATAKQSPSSEV